MSNRELSDVQKYWNGARDNMKHWKGSRKLKNAVQWGNYQNKSLNRVKHLQEIANTEYSESLFEWGTGGGLNLEVLSTHFKNLYGVDIAQSSVEETRKVVPIADVRKISIDLSDFPEDFLSTLQVEVIISLAVFFHFPSIEYAEKVLKIMHTLLQPRGLCLIQTREYQDTAERERVLGLPYGQAPITPMGDQEFQSICRGIGFTIKEVETLSNEKDIFYFYYLQEE